MNVEHDVKRIYNDFKRNKNFMKKLILKNYDFNLNEIDYCLSQTNNANDFYGLLSFRKLNKKMSDVRKNNRMSNMWK